MREVQAMAKQALSGLKVVEYGEFIAAPYCAKLMADMGAEVIKIEEPGLGDEARRYGPFPNDIPHPERSGLFLYLNSNKLGITLSLRTATGLKIVKELLHGADVFIESNPPRLMREHGLDYPSLQEVNRRIVMTSITPFGQSGPYKDYNGYDINSQSLGGESAVLGSPDREPLVYPGQLGTYQAAANAAAATMVALFARELTGQGQHVDISESDIMATMTRGIAMPSFVHLGIISHRLGHRGSARMWPWCVLPCKDGYVAVMSMEDHHWKTFIKAIGSPEWAMDSRFTGSQFDRMSHADELEARLTGWLMDHTKDEFFEIALKNNLTFMKAFDTADLLESTQLRERDFFVEIEHPEAGLLKYPGAPAKLAKTPWRVGRRAPLLGEHNEEVLCKRLGYSREDLVDMWRTGVI